MKISISYPPNSTELKTVVETKITNFRKKYPIITLFELKCIDDNYNDEKVVLMNVHVPDHDISIHKKSNSYEKSVNNAFNTLTRQLNKVKELK